MTRGEALLKLLAIEPETKDALIRVTGWPPEETLAVLRDLVAQHRIKYGRAERYEPIRYYVRQA